MERGVRNPSLDMLAKTLKMTPSGLREKKWTELELVDAPEA